MVKNQDASIGSVIFLTFAAVFLLVSTCSAPIFDGVRMFRLRTNVDGFRRYIDYGLWGYCIPELSRIGRQDLRFTDECSSSKLGWVIDDHVVDILNAPGLMGALSSGHTSALIMIPVATILTVASLVLAVILYLSRRRAKLANTIGSRVSQRTLTTLVIVNASILLFTIITWFIMFSVGWVLDDAVDRIAGLNLHFDNIPWLVGLAVAAHIWNVSFLYILRKNYGLTSPNAHHYYDHQAQVPAPVFYPPTLPQEPTPSYAQATSYPSHVYPPQTLPTKTEYDAGQHAKRNLDEY